MSQSRVSLLDEVVRIYKNNAGRVIGIHTIGIHEQAALNPEVNGKIAVPNKRFARTATISVKFDRFNLSMGESRAIVTVQMIGKYDDFAYNQSNTDIIQITYQGNDENHNTVNIDLSQFPTIGQTL